MTRIKLIKKFQRICWVCNREVIPNDIYSVKGKDQADNTIIRHSKCAIGSTNWLRSNVAKQSKFYKLYEKEVREANE